MKKIPILRLSIVIAGVAVHSGFVIGQSVSEKRPLEISDDGRSIVEGNGVPFFYLADTCWELFHRTTREEATRYLEDRASKGFTVIQAVGLAEIDGLKTPNSYGHLPLENLDPSRPLVKDGPDNDYWDHVDYVFSEAERLGLWIAFLPSWADKWYLKWGVGPEVFTPSNAYAFASWVGQRYARRNVIWVIGGDRNPETNLHYEILNAMVRGIREADGGRNLMTFHPQGGSGSSQFFEQDSWIDFNARQNGHQPEYKHFGDTLKDYQLEPAKPVIDIEPLYEDHPLHFAPSDWGYSVAADIRRPLYWNLFNGAAGHTYGHHSIWQMYQPGRAPVNGPLMSWQEALDQPGSGQMQYGRWLVLSRNFLERVPDSGLIEADSVETAVPGAGRYRFSAMRGSDRSWLMVYVPTGRAFSVKTGELSGETLRLWWFNPRTGDASDVGESVRKSTQRFISPTPGEDLDWVLVIDDASRGYPAPGTYQ